MAAIFVIDTDDSSRGLIFTRENDDQMSPEVRCIGGYLAILTDFNDDVIRKKKIIY